jgi:hypothetical protein
VHRSSPSIASLAAALAKAEAELVNPEKSLTATIRSGERGRTELTFRYAPLSSGLDIVRKALGQHEIATVPTRRTCCSRYNLHDGCIHAMHGRLMEARSHFDLLQPSVAVVPINSASVSWFTSMANGAAGSAPLSEQYCTVLTLTRAYFQSGVLRPLACNVHFQGRFQLMKLRWEFGPRGDEDVFVGRKYSHHINPY